MNKKSLQISDFATVGTGLLSRTGIEPTPEGSHFLLQIRDFRQDRQSFDKETVVRISPDNFRKEQELEPGDVLFLAKGANNFGFAVKDLPGPTLAASYFFVIHPRPEVVLPEYLAWVLNLDATKRDLSRYTGYSAHMPVVRRDVLESLRIPLPSLDIQRKIVELDCLMRRQQELLGDLAAKQKSLITKACTKLATC